MLMIVAWNGGHLSFLQCFLGFYRIRGLKLLFFLFGMLFFSATKIHPPPFSFEYTELIIFFNSLATISTLYTVPDGLGAAARLVCFKMFPSRNFIIKVVHTTVIDYSGPT